MRSLIAALLLSVFALMPMVAPVSAQGVSITPAVGDETDTFTVAGEGLPPGLALDVNFVSPSGQVFSTAALNKVVVVDGDGEFGMDVTPATDFAGQPSGTWTVQVCVTGTNDCVQTTFQIEV